MATIKLFESWLKEQLTPLNEDIFFTENGSDGNDITVGGTAAQLYDFPGYSEWLRSDAGENFRAFASQFGKGTNNVDVYKILASLMKRGAAESKFLGLTLKGDSKIVTKAWEQLVKTGNPKINVEDQVSVSVTMDPKIPTHILTRGQVVNMVGTRLNADSTNPRVNNGSSHADALISFINQYNVTAYAFGQPQYKLSDPERMSTEDQSGKVAGTGFLDLISAADSATSQGIYVYTKQAGAMQSAGAEKVETQVETGGQQAATSQYDTDFAVGKSDVLSPKVAAAVKKAAHEIAQLFPAGKGPDTFKLTSGASADWNGKLPTSTGTGATFTGKTENEKTNQKLAYDRGFNFMTAVNAELVKMGHPGFPKFTVSWVIGDTGGPAKNGKYVDLMLATQEVKPTVTTVTSYKSAVTGDAVKVAGKGTIIEHNIYLYFAQA
jgi:hypothetical protein